MAGFSTTTGGLNFQYPNRDTQNWDAVMSNTFATISSHDHDRDTAGRGATLNDRSLLLNNAGWLQASDLAGTGLVNLIRATTSDTIELGGAFATLDIAGALTAGTLSVSGLAVLSAAATIGTTLTVSGLTTMSAAATVGTTLGVTGLTSLSTLNTSGLAAFSAAVTVGTTLTVSGLTTLSAAATVGGTLGVSGITTLSAATTIEDDLTVTGTTILGPLTHPAADGTANQVLQTDAAGNLSFGDKGRVLQRVYAESSTAISTTLTASTPPVISEGVEVITLDITPKSTTSTLAVECVTGEGTNTTVARFYRLALFKNTTSAALACVMSSEQSVASYTKVTPTLIYNETSTTLDVRTFKIRFSTSSGTAKLLQNFNNIQQLGGIEKISISIVEIEA